MVCQAAASDEALLVLHPGGNVALGMKYAPDIDVIRAFNVENEVGVARKLSGAKTRKVQFMPKARRTRARMAGDVRIGLFECVDEAERNR